MRGAASPARKEPRIRNRLVPFIVSAAVLLVDQVSKLLIVAGLKPYEVLPVVGSLLQFKLRYNPYGVLSISFGADYIYYVVNAIGILALVYFMLKVAVGRFDRMVLGAILGGALGNTLDRLRIDKVIDFVDMGIGNARWPTYNLADAALTIGILLIVANEFFGRRKRGRHDCVSQRDEPRCHD